uniref:Uncharacterized protein n=1 Tax=Rhizophagus irregularis (strain DAOM 181602 / DAOM 197198 / MUCL 43194) TaxID=747089 RepID=U9U9Y5_RHIID
MSQNVLLSISFKKQTTANIVQQISNWNLFTGLSPRIGFTSTTDDICSDCKSAYELRLFQN